ncbi:hypothetical protein B0H19DRAFT_1277331 [Mycena capillaripes]|nr:hypothetical protein B0H19DRAFT_1277331 [Mycena capillaripes]
MVTAQKCRPVCCDAIVLDVDSQKVGIHCTSGGLDCGFTGQVAACCKIIVPIGEHTGRDVLDHGHLCVDVTDDTLTGRQIEPRAPRQSSGGIHIMDSPN